MIEKLNHLLRLLLVRRSAGIRYRIGGVVYLQRPLVLLQIEQLCEYLSTISLPPGSSVPGIVRALGDRLAEGLAIVLIPQGVAVDEKDCAVMARELRNHVDLETAVKVVEDFLSCNPMGSVFEKVTAALGKCGKVLSAAPGSPSSSASSPPAT